MTAQSIAPSPGRLILLVLTALGVGTMANAVSHPDEVNSTGKGYVTIQRTGGNNFTLEKSNATDDTSLGSTAPRPAPLQGSPPPSSSASATGADGVRTTGLYSINGGKPFFLDRNPITGAVDFPAAVDYDDYVIPEDEGDSIDRKDSATGTGVGRPSYNVFGAKAGNHKYHHNDKVPLISGSYANTKVQGTAGGGYRTRQPTSPTPTPSYYPMRMQTSKLTAPSTSATTASTTTTSTTTTTTTTTTTQTPPYMSSTPPSILSSAEQTGLDAAHQNAPAYEYEYEYVDNYAAEDGLVTVTARPPSRTTFPPTRNPSTTTQQKTSPSSTTTVSSTTQRPLSPQPSTTPSTTMVTSITPRPTITTPYKPTVSQPFTYSSQSPASSPLVSEPPLPTSTLVPTIIYKEPNNIVTSMPLGTHFHFRPSTPPPSLPKQPDSAAAASAPKPSQRPDINANVVLAGEINPYGIRAEEPFRPIFGPGEGIEETVPPSRRPTGSQTPVLSIPSETPSRLNYPPNEGTSTYFLLRPDAKHPGPPRPLNSKLPLSSQRPFPTRVPDKLSADKTPQGQKPSGSAPAPWILPAGGGHKTQVKFPGESEHSNKVTPRPADEAKPMTHITLRPSLPPPPPSSQPPRPPSRLPSGPLPSPATELRPPVQPDNVRPGWPLRPPHHAHQHGPPVAPQHARPKVDATPPKFAPNGYGLGSHNGNRKPPVYAADRPLHAAAAPRPDTYGGPGLPNILPQFRPNVKVSHGHTDGNFRHPNRPQFFANQHRPPLTERLHPPPPPPPPQSPTRLNRNDAEAELPPAAPFPPPPPRPLMRRRTVPQGHEVATLQMMQMKRHQSVEAPSVPPHAPAPQHAPPTPTPSSPTQTPGASEKRPVYVVYPTKGDLPGGDGGVVVGTRGPHLPVPPSNLRLDDKDDLPLGPPFGHVEPQKPLLQTAKEREDSLKAKTTPERPMKTDFPYPLVRPDSFQEVDDKKKEVGSGSSEDKESFPYARTENEKRTDSTITGEKPNDDPEINIIPYLQDYMPFATKKPNVPGTISSQISHFEHDSKARIVTVGSTGSKIQSIHLSPAAPVGSQETKTISQSNSNYFASVTPKIKDQIQISSTPRPGLQQGLVGAGNSEFTVSAIMHTQPQFAHSQDKSSPGNVGTSPQQSTVNSPSNHRPANGNQKTPSAAASLNFQAPFLASVNMGSAPVNQGWSVVGANTEQRMKPGTVDKAELDRSDVNVSQLTGDSNEKQQSSFDFENFKPQLFGGFQPIYSLPEDSKSQRQQITTERQEKKLE